MWFIHLELFFIHESSMNADWYLISTCSMAVQPRIKFEHLVSIGRASLFWWESLLKSKQRVPILLLYTSLKYTNAYRILWEIDIPQTMLSCIVSWHIELWRRTSIDHTNFSRRRSVMNVKGHEQSYILPARTSGSSLNCANETDSKIAIHMNVLSAGW